MLGVMTGERGTDQVDPTASPLARDPLIGRDPSVREVLEGLAPGRIVTIVGIGGVGKSRLATEVVTRARHRGDPAMLLDLSARMDGSDILTDLALALGMSQPDGTDPRRIATVLDAIPGRVVVLDNLEQLRGAGPAITELLATGTQARIVGTSRIPLGIDAELVVGLDPLELPRSAAIDDVLIAPSTTLFVRRARQVGRLESIDPATARDIARVCRLLDGLPLAIELAAARTRLLTPGAIARRLAVGEAEPLLATIDSAAGARSLEGVLEWTIGLLGDEERGVLEAVSLFEGPFDLEMAAAMQPAAATLDAFEHLVALSLVRYEPALDGEPRLQLLEVVRAHCRRLLPADALVPLRDRHAIAIAASVRRLEQELLGSERGAARSRLAAQLDDLRSAFDFSLPRDAPLAIGLIAPVWRFWASIGRQRDAIQRLRRAIATDGLPPSARGWALAGLAGLLHDAEGDANARQAAAEAVRIGRRLRDRSLELEALPAVVLSAIAEGDERTARTAARRFVSLARAGNDRRALVRALATLGLAEGNFGNLAAGVRSLQDAVAVARQNDDPLNEAIQLTNLAELELDRKRWRDALMNAGAAVAILRGVDPGPYLVPALLGVGHALAELGRLEDARASLAEAAALVTEAGASRQVSELLLHSLPYLTRTAADELALRAWGCVLRLVAAGDVTLHRDARELGARLLDAEAERVGEQALRRAVRAGEASAPADIVRELRAALDRRTVPVEARSTPSRFVLTQREGEVFRLLAGGMSDREVAEHLAISAKTASVHVANIKSKLGVRTRLEAAMIARTVADIGSEPHLAAGANHPSS